MTSTGQYGRLVIIVGNYTYEQIRSENTLDKYEYKVRADEIKALITAGDYAQAAEIADTIDWRRVKSVMMLCTISDLYKINKRYEDAKALLLLAYERRPGGKTICYSLCELCLKTEEYVRAVNYYKEYVQAAPSDPGRYILQYKLYEAQEVGLDERIKVLEELKAKDYREKWAYELAYLYHKVGEAGKCVDECDELILWFGEGKYVWKAMELKMQHEPLSESQQEKYDHRFDEPAELPVEEQPAEEVLPEGYADAGVGELPGEFDTPAEPAEEQAPAEETTEEPELDIMVKTMEFGQYNTINLQAELAEGLKAVLDEEQRSKLAEQLLPDETTDAEETEALPEEEYPAEEIPAEEEAAAEETDLEATRIFNPADVNKAVEALQNQEAVSTDTMIMPLPDEMNGEMIEQEDIPQETEVYLATEEIPTEEIEEAIEDGQEYAVDEYGEPVYEEEYTDEYASDEYVSEEEYVPEGEYASEEYSDEYYAEEEPVSGGMVELVYQEEATKVIPVKEIHAALGEEPEEAAEETAEKTVEETAEEEKPELFMEGMDPAEAAAMIMKQMREETLARTEKQAMTAQPPKEMAEVLSQESDGQISLVVPDEQKAIEEQITGQISIDEVLDEWERIKQENAEKHKEEMRQHVLEETGTMFTEFDIAIRDGILEQLESGKSAKEVLGDAAVEEFEEAEEAAEEAVAEIPAEPIEVEAPVSIAQEETEEEDTVDFETPTEWDSFTDDEAEEAPLTEAEKEVTEDWETTDYGEVEEIAEIEEVTEEAAEEVPEEMTEEAAEEETFEEEIPEEEIPEEETAEEEIVEEIAEEAVEEVTEEATEEAEEAEAPAEEEAHFGFVDELEDAEETVAETEETSEEEPAEEAEETPAEAEAEPVKSGLTGSSAPTRKPVEREKAKVRALTHEEKELYSDFIQSRTDREKLVRAIDAISMAPYTGNVIITGDEGMDTLTLAKNMIREVQMTDSNFSGKVAKISGQGMNKKNVAETLEHLKNGALIIQKASGMNDGSIHSLYRALQQDNMGIIVILEDTKKDMVKLLKANPMLKEVFTARMDVEALSNETLARIAKKYAYENEYSIDELGMMALHARIEEMQTSDHNVTVADVREIVDNAIHSANRKTLGHFFDILFAKRYDEEDMVILTEKDFN